jgi:CheY-like chemotaxis protein
VKFTPKHGRVQVSLRRVGSNLELGVEDSGKGIDPSFVPHVFEAFRQEDGSASRARGGLGLGLAITRQLVELHGGQISAHSEGDGRGARFVVSLPVAPLAAHSEGAQHAVRELSAVAPFDRPSHLRGLSVLVVDDEEDARSLVAMVLEDCGCRVLMAQSVREGLQQLELHRPDLLISDIGMPDEDGYDFIRQVRGLPRERGGDIPAAALTAYARPEDRRRLLNAGYSIHLAKPVEPAELVAVVATLSRFLHR